MGLVQRSKFPIRFAIVSFASLNVAKVSTVILAQTFKLVLSMVSLYAGLKYAAASMVSFV